MKISKLVKRLSLGLGILVVGATLAACASNSSKSSNYKSDLNNSKEITIGLEGTYAPYSFRENGKLTGFEVDLGKQIAKQIGVKAVFVPTKWDGLIAGLGSQKYDMVMNNITPTPERKKAYLFSTPYVNSRYVMVSRSNDNSLKGVSDIKGKTFVQSTGTDNAVVAQKYGAKVVPVEQFQTQLEQIKQGRADGAINSQGAVAAYAKSNSMKGLKTHLLTDKEQKPAPISALFNKQDTKLRDRVNKAIKALIKDGTVSKLAIKYFGTDISK